MVLGVKPGNMRLSLCFLALRHRYFFIKWFDRAVFRVVSSNFRRAPERTAQHFTRALSASSNSDYTAALLDLLLNMPSPLVESSTHLAKHFEPLPGTSVRDKIALCSKALLVCFQMNELLFGKFGVYQADEHIEAILGD